MFEKKVWKFEGQYMNNQNMSTFNYVYIISIGPIFRLINIWIGWVFKILGRSSIPVWLPRYPPPPPSHLRSKYAETSAFWLLYTTTLELNCSLTKVIKYSTFQVNSVCLYVHLSYDVATGSEITPCNKICKPLVVYRFSGNVITYITTLLT